MSTTQLMKAARAARIHYMIRSGDSTGLGGDAPIALAVSDFDGAHSGHAALAHRAAALAEASGARPVALLPWPSPAGGDNIAAPRLTTLEERIERLRALGVFTDIVIVPAPSEPLPARDALARARALGDVRALVCEAASSGAALALLPRETVALAVGAGIAAEALGADGADGRGWAAWRVDWGAD